MSEGRIALVTGASGGIGGACAVALAAAGYRIAVHYHANSDGARETLAMVQAAGSEGWLVPFDITDPTAVDRAVRGLVKEKGRLDVVVAAAGVVFSQMLALTGLDDLDHLWKVNLRGPYLVAKAASKPMIKARWGRIVFIGSVIALRGNAGQSAYTATKAGLVGLAKSLARELAPRNITVNVVEPGFVETRATKGLTPAMRDAILQRIPIQRPGRPEEVAEMVAFVCSENSDYITGAVLPVDGGMGA